MRYLEVNGNLAYPIEMEGLRPYVGGGLNIARVGVSFDDPAFPDDSQTEVGLNLLGGLDFLLGSVSSFVETRFERGGGEQFVLSAGVLFGGQ